MPAAWEGPYPSLGNLLAQTIVPGASVEKQRRYANDTLEAITVDEIARHRYVNDRIDVIKLLPQVQAPCFVLHNRGDRVHPIDHGHLLEAWIPNARFIAYERDNHVFIGDDPDWPLARREILNLKRRIVDASHGSLGSTQPCSFSYPPRKVLPNHFDFAGR